MMSVAVLPAPVSVPPVPASPSSNGPVLLTGIRWQTYEALLADIGDRAIRLTYDRGSLEIMAPAYRHEVTSKWIGQLVEIMAEESNLEHANAGSTTFRLEDLERGLEPDECFYLANEPLVRGHDKIDLTRDPPPDLAIEVDVTSSSLNRMDIYAAMGVPEVWRWREGKLIVYQLQADKTYAVVQVSPTFPKIPLNELADFVSQAFTVGQLTLKRSFRAWVREQLQH